MPIPDGQALLWDVFCRVVDNHGDVGVCWRLAVGLVDRGHSVRLWVDDPSALAWMAPSGAAGVQLIRWHPESPIPEPGDVVIEAFGCDPPAAFVAAMARRAVHPAWINLEYLSAEDYVERSHGLASPQWHGPAAGLTKWFFYPGFTAGTGGLLREAWLDTAPSAFEANAWRAAHEVAPRPGERLVSLFCYPNPAIESLLHRLADRPTLLLATPGPATQAASGIELPPGVRVQALPWLTQLNYDRLLWACDINFVRGEDSFVRAQWAGRPFIWHIYPQHDDAHIAKLDAFLSRYLSAAPTPLADDVAHWMRAWNGLPTAEMPARWPDQAEWTAHALRWRDTLRSQNDLVTSLLAFVAEKR